MQSTDYNGLMTKTDACPYWVIVLHRLQERTVQEMSQSEVYLLNELI